MIKSTTIEILEDFIALFFPHYCRGCREGLVKGEEFICSGCRMDLPRSNYHIERDNPFYNKLKGRIPVKYVMTFLKFSKGSKVQNILHALKYRNEPELGFALGRIYGEDLLQSNYKNEFDLIIPVPLHRSRKRKRGYNQSEEFGKGLSVAFDIPCSDNFMKRLIQTESQTRKTKLSRWENVSDAFEVIRPKEILNRRILLVDDVVTTGATLEACAQALIDAGSNELSIACLASA